MALKIAQGMTLPTDAVTQVFGIIARRGRGKTYTASVMAEEMVREGLPFVVLDPLGAWWGLRSNADGTKAGLPVVILGGEHGDIPLEATGGRAVADFIVAHPGHYILDLSGFDSNAAQERFSTDFAERLYRAKATERAALHLFVDEADSFAPQRTTPGQQRMLGAFEALARRGRIRGIGLTVITQRPASLNKNVLTQVECLISMQITGPQDRAAVDDWVKQYGEPGQRAEWLASLASLAIGEAWVWSPSWLQKFERVRIRQRRTYDSGKTPEPGQASVDPKAMAKVDIAALASDMAATIEKAKADDPVELRKEIAKLRRQVAEALDSGPVPEPVQVIVERPVVNEGAIAEFVGVEAVLEDALKRLKSGLTAAAILPEDTIYEAGERRVQVTTVPRPPRDFPTMLGDAVRSAPPRPPVSDGADVNLKAGARKMLEVLARHYPMRVTRPQLGALARLAWKGGTFGTYFGILKRAGYIEEVGDEIAITDAGLAKSGVDYRQPLSTDEIREQWRGILKAGARRMFDALIEAYPAGLSREELGTRADIEMSGGTFGTYLGILRRNALVEEQNGTVRAAEIVIG